MYAYSYSRNGPWKGSFNSRIEAEESGRALRHMEDRREGKPRRFVMMWTARIIKLSIGDLVRQGHLLNLLADRSDYSLSTANVDKDALHALEDEVGQVIDSWSAKHSIQRYFDRYIELEPGFHCIDYESAQHALSGGDSRYKADSPIKNETHYMVVWGRILRFKNRAKRVDLQGVSLDDRITTMTLAMAMWDIEFPVPGIHQYEQRNREIKAVLGSPWPDLGSFSTGSITPDQRANRTYYYLLQREERWLKQRLTAIYRTRELRRVRPVRPACISGR